DAATAELRQLSHVYQQHLAQQREEMQAVVAATSSASATPRLASRQESSLSPRMVAVADAAASSINPSSGAASASAAVAVATDGSAVSPAAASHAITTALEAEVSELRTALEAADSERERLKGQLLRLKAQMLREQEEEEDKVGWRVEAEVKAAEERYKGMVSELREALEAARAAAARQEAEVKAINEALELKDTEIQNLQAALGELTYESEAAEKLRLEVRATANKVAKLQQELAAAQAAVAAAQAEKQGAERLVEQTRTSLAAVVASEARTADECAMLRRALDQAVAQAAAMSSETNGMVDRRIMGKLLLTYFQRNHSKEVLQLMARMLNMSDDDRAALGLMGSRRGLLSRVAGAPLALVSGAGRMLVRAGSQGSPGGGHGGGFAAPPTGGGGDSLADQWVQFLLSQDEAAQRQQQLQLQQQQHPPLHSAGGLTHSQAQAGSNQQQPDLAAAAAAALSYSQTTVAPAPTSSSFAAAMAAPSPPPPPQQQQQQVQSTNHYPHSSTASMTQLQLYQASAAAAPPLIRSVGPLSEPSSIAGYPHALPPSLGTSAPPAQFRTPSLEPLSAPSHLQVHSSLYQAPGLQYDTVAGPYMTSAASEAAMAAAASTVRPVHQAAIPTAA
ncbi:hypothetical protein Vretimale_14473, partial [Volvox reticuliferus]